MRFGQPPSSCALRRLFDDAIENRTAGRDPGRELLRTPFHTTHTSGTELAAGSYSSRDEFIKERKAGDHEGWHHPVDWRDSSSVDKEGDVRRV